MFILFSFGVIEKSLFALTRLCIKTKESARIYLRLVQRRKVTLAQQKSLEWIRLDKRNWKLLIFQMQTLVGTGFAWNYDLRVVLIAFCGCLYFVTPNIREYFANGLFRYCCAGVTNNNYFLSKYRITICDEIERERDNTQPTKCFAHARHHTMFNADGCMCAREWQLAAATSNNKHEILCMHDCETRSARFLFYMLLYSICCIRVAWGATHPVFLLYG